MNFIFLIIQVLVVKNVASSTCGTELYTIYHAALNTTCYFVEELDDLPVADEANIPEDTIFFIDPSCKGGLSIREACSVEAAARLNPKRQVNVFFAGPVAQKCINSEPLASLLSYKNVRLNRIIVEEFANGTGLRNLLQNIDVDGNPYPVLYTLDLLKFIVLYKFKGIYMDLDMVATRSFDELPHGGNWVGIGDHSHGVLSASIFAASSDDVGRKFARQLVNVLKTDPVTDVGSFSVMKYAVERICGFIPFNKTVKGLSFSCHGLVVYATKFFFPVGCEYSLAYFSNYLDINNVTRSFTQQICNAVTYKEPILKDSTYAQLMSKYCPKVYGHLKKNNFNETINEEERKEGTNGIGDQDDSITRKDRSEDTAVKKSGRWYYEVKVKVGRNKP